MSKEKENKKKVNVGAVVILVISVIVFLPVGGYGIFSQIMQQRNNNNNKIVFGSYDGKEIAYEGGSSLFTKVANMANQYSMFGYNVSENQNGVRDFIFEEAYNSCLEEIEYPKAVKKANYTVPAKAVNRELVGYFLDSNGNFDERSFAQATATEVNSIRDAIKDDLIIQRYQDDILGNSTTFWGESVYGLKISEAEKNFIAQMGTEKHSFEIALWSTTSFPTSEAKEFAIKNPSLFDKFNLSAITLSSMDDAKAVLKQLKANEIAFEDAVSLRSSQTYTDALGKLSTPYRYYLTKETLVNEDDLSKIEALADGEYSEIIETKQAYSEESTYTIFKKDGITVTPDLNDEEIANIAYDYIRFYERGYMEEYFVNIASNFVDLEKITNFETACVNFNTTKTELEAFPINYGNVQYYNTTATVSNLSLYTNKDVLSKLFSLKTNEITEPVVSGDIVMVAKCTGIQKDEAPETETYDSVIASNDKKAARNHLWNSEKHVNGFMMAYFTNFGLSSGLPSSLF